MVLLALVPAKGGGKPLFIGALTARCRPVAGVVPHRGLQGAWVETPGTVRTEPLRGGDGLATCLLGMTAVWRTGASCRIPMAAFKLPHPNSSGQTTPVQLPHPKTATLQLPHTSGCFQTVTIKRPHPNSHVQTNPSPSVTFQQPRSNHHISTAMFKPPQSNFHIPTAMFKPVLVHLSHPNGHVQTTPVQLPQLPCSDHHVPTAAIHCYVPTTMSLLVAQPAEVPIN